jgi:hypothetical protein
MAESEKETTGGSLEERILEKFGVRNSRRLNCAQFVAEILREQFPLDEQTVASFSSCGGGRAPEECCGAFYAAKLILERYSPQRTGEVMEQFRSFGGSLKCREIKALKKKSCRECIEKAVEIIKGR